MGTLKGTSPNCQVWWLWALQLWRYNDFSLACDLAITLRLTKGCYSYIHSWHEGWSLRDFTNVKVLEKYMWRSLWQFGHEIFRWYKFLFCRLFKNMYCFIFFLNFDRIRNKPYHILSFYFRQFNISVIQSISHTIYKTISNTPIFNTFFIIYWNRDWMIFWWNMFWNLWSKCLKSTSR